MPRVERFYDEIMGTLLRSEMFAEALGCAAATERRMLPLRGAVRQSDLDVLARVMLCKCAALVHLRRYNESRFAARRASQMMGLLQGKSESVQSHIEMLYAALRNLENLAGIGSSLDDAMARENEEPTDRRRLEHSAMRCLQFQSDAASIALWLMQELLCMVGPTPSVSEPCIWDHTIYSPPPECVVLFTGPELTGSQLSSYQAFISGWRLPAAGGSPARLWRE